MKLKVLEQIHVSSLSRDTLRPRETIEVSDAQGAELLKAHPDKFEKLRSAKARPASENKAEPAPKNKAEPTPANKSRG